MKRIFDDINICYWIQFKCSFQFPFDESIQSQHSWFVSYSDVSKFLNDTWSKIYNIPKSHFASWELVLLGTNRAKINKNVFLFFDLRCLTCVKFTPCFLCLASKDEFLLFKINFPGSTSNLTHFEEDPPKTFCSSFCIQRTSPKPKPIVQYCTQHPKK
jgi:hypothetical protein